MDKADPFDINTSLKPSRKALVWSSMPLVIKELTNWINFVCIDHQLCLQIICLDTQIAERKIVQHSTTYLFILNLVTKPKYQVPSTKYQAKVPSKNQVTSTKYPSTQVPK